MKGITIISGVIFLAITIMATMVVYQASLPVISKLQAAAYVEKSKDTFTRMDKIIKDVASEGKGSKRTISIENDAGKMVFNGTTDTIYWEYETDSLVFSPRTYQKYGNLKIGANLNVDAYEGTYNSQPALILENEYLRAYIKKIGSQSNFTTLNTSSILLAIYNKDTMQWFNNPQMLQISIDNTPESETGNGYSMLEESGYDLPYGTVTCYVNTSYISYFVNITLEAGSDFLIIEGEMG